MTTWFEDLPFPHVGAVLCDADGTLFPSEEPAYEASAVVTNRFLSALGVEREYEPAELQQLTNGRNFRSSAALLADLHDRRLDEAELEHWVGVERDVVTAHLRAVLRRDAQVCGPLAELGRRWPLAVVTSSAAQRLAACLEVTELAPLFEPDHLFSAESSLPRPVSKPDPAVYTFACDRLGVDPSEAVAVEDSVNGALSAVAAGCWTIGTVQFVPEAQRADRVAAPREAGAVVVVASWWEVVRMLKDPTPAIPTAQAAGAGA